MAKKIILFFLIVLTVGLDSTLIPSFAVWDIQINLTLCVVVALGIVFGRLYIDYHFFQGFTGQPSII